MEDNGVRRPSSEDVLALELLEHYGEWAACLVPVCGPDVHSHSVESERGIREQQLCRSPGKRPVQQGWQKEAIRRVEELAQLLPEERSERLRDHALKIARHIVNGQNVGLLCPPGVLIVDVDDAESLAIAESIQGMKSVPRQLSSKGGHYFFSAPPAASVWRQKTKLRLRSRMTVDLRLAGKGLVVCWPSKHASGFEYHFDRKLPTDPSDLQSIPASLEADLIEASEEEKSESQHRAPFDWPKEGDRWQGSTKERHEKLRSASWVLAKAGLPEDLILEMLCTLNQKHCVPPKDVADLRRLANSASVRLAERASHAQPAESSEPILEFEPMAEIGSRDLAPFPVEAMYPFEQYISSLATFTQTPPDLAGVIVLGFAGGAVAGKFQVNAGWLEELSLYCAVVMGPGNRKSEVFKHASRPVARFEREVQEAMRPEILQNKVSLEMKKSRLSYLRKVHEREKDSTKRDQTEAEMLQAVREVDEAGRKPMEDPRLIASDTTPEKLASLLAAHGETMIIASADGLHALDRACRYTRDGNPNLDIYLMGHDGDRCIVDRQLGGTIRLERPVLTIVSAIQPIVLQQLAAVPAFTGRGMLDRFAWSVPRSNQGYRNQREVIPINRAAELEYEETMSRMLKVKMNVDRPGVLRVHVEPLAMFREFAQSVEERLKEEGDLEELPGWASKLPGLVLRIAGVLAIAERPEAPEIDNKVMGNAIALGRYFLDHSIAAFEMMNGLTGDKALDKVLRWLRRRENVGEPFSKRELFQGVKGGRIRIAQDLNGPLERLRISGRIAPIPQERSGRGRPTSLWAINPVWSRELTRGRGEKMSSIPPEIAPEWVGHSGEDIGGSGGTELGEAGE